MRQITKILAMALMAVLFAGSAWAYSEFTWDLSKFGFKALDNQTSLTFSEITFENGAGKIPAATIIQDVDTTTGFVYENARFSEFGVLGVISLDGDANRFYQAATDTRGYLFYEFSDLSGYVYGIDYETLKYNIAFDSGVGSVELKYTLDPTLQTSIGTLATYEVLRAGSTGFTVQEGFGGGTGGFGFDLKMVDVLEDFWFFDGKSADQWLLEGYTILAESSSIGATILPTSPEWNPGDAQRTLYVVNDGSLLHAVPEPGTLLLLGAGLLGLGAVARRRKN